MSNIFCIFVFLNYFNMKINLFKQLDELRGINPQGIYLLSINNNCYIGSSMNIKKRLRHHRRELRLNIHDNKYLQNSYNKYKICEYEILEICNNLSIIDLRKLEKFWINKLNPKFNIQDPVSAIGGYNQKKVYQYSIDGKFIKEWDSCMIASRELNLNYGCLHSCANENVTHSKSAYGYIWSYKKLSEVKYQNNTGCNLTKVPVYLYKISGEFYKEFNSLSDCARFLANEFNYTNNWNYIRSQIGYILRKPETRTFRKLYKISYVKSNRFPLSMGS